MNIGFGTAGRDFMIPLEINQLWIEPVHGTGSVPADVAANIADWKRTHPAFTHTVWALNKVLQYLPQDSADLLLDLLSVCRFEAMQADLARLFLLFHRGGFWADLRLRPLCSFLGDYAAGDLLLVEHFKSEYIHNTSHVFINSIFGCCPRNPFIGQCLARATANVRRRLSSTVWEVSGPKVFMDTREVILRQGGQDLTDSVLPSEAVWGRLVEIGSGSYAIGNAHWSVREQNETMYLDGGGCADPTPVWRTRYLA